MLDTCFGQIQNIKTENHNVWLYQPVVRDLFFMDYCKAHMIFFCNMRTKFAYDDNNDEDDVYRMTHERQTWLQ